MFGMRSRYSEKLAVRGVVPNAIDRCRQFVELPRIGFGGRQWNSRDPRTAPFMREDPFEKCVSRSGLSFRVQVLPVLLDDLSRLVDEEVSIRHDSLQCTGARVDAWPAGALAPVGRDRDIRIDHTTVGS